MEKIAIWGASIPYNHPEVRKKDLMQIRKMPKFISALAMAKDVFGRAVAKDSGGLDTYTYLEEIKSGKASKNMDDVPNLIPFLREGADTAVIIAPGGGFCTQARENEGYAIARALNKKGISAFVLEYRLNPYEAPVCYLDMQRAIRYVRCHASGYGLRPDRIGAMGFSAGAYAAGASAILLGDSPVDYPGYVPDQVDAVNALPDFLGLIYPVTNFEYNPSMLCLLAGDGFFDDQKRPALQKRYSLTENLGRSEIPQFLCYGTLDPLKGMDRYAVRLDELQVPHRTLVLKGASHGFALIAKKYAWWLEEYVQWINECRPD